MRWVSHRNGVPNPFLELQAPPRPRQESDWLTRAEFAALLDGAAHPVRHRAGLVERDQLVLLTLVMTGLRRSELIALDWRDVTLAGPRPSLLVRRGKGGRPRRQPLPSELARRLSRWRAEREASASHPVFCGLGGARLQPAILAGIIHRSATRTGIDKHVTAHTLRHTAATWLRQATGYTRLSPSISGTQTSPRWPVTRASPRRSFTRRPACLPRMMFRRRRAARRARQPGDCTPGQLAA
jgi:integrase